MLRLGEISIFYGPLPHPDVLVAYDAIESGLANRIVTANTHALLRTSSRRSTWDAVAVGNGAARSTRASALAMSSSKRRRALCGTTPPTRKAGLAIVKLRLTVRAAPSDAQPMEAEQLKGAKTHGSALALGVRDADSP